MSSFVLPSVFSLKPTPTVIEDAAFFHNIRGGSWLASKGNTEDIHLLKFEIMSAHNCLKCAVTVQKGDSELLTLPGVPYFTARDAP